MLCYKESPFIPNALLTTGQNLRTSRPFVVINKKRQHWVHFHVKCVPKKQSCDSKGCERLMIKNDFECEYLQTNHHDNPGKILSCVTFEF